MDIPNQIIVYMSLSISSMTTLSDNPPICQVFLDAEQVLSSCILWIDSGHNVLFLRFPYLCWGGRGLA